MADQNNYPVDDTGEQPEENSAKDAVDLKELRQKIGRTVGSVKKYTQKMFEQEVKHYVNVFRGEIRKILPERLLKMDDVDVNVVFPVIKTLIPSLYFQDPKIFVKPEQEKIVIEYKDPETGQPVTDETGKPRVDVYNAAESAMKFQAKLNTNIRKAKLKREMKSALVDAHLGFYGAVKLGWGNEQGVASMGEGAPPSYRDDTDMDMAYGIRLSPEDVYVDLTDFYNPEWIAVRYEVHPEQLKKDSRLTNTENLKGNCELKDSNEKEIWKDLDKADYVKTEYFEYYHKPCAQYPEGIYAIYTDEVKDDFLYYGPWPYTGEDTKKTFPIKLLYFTPNPDGKFPIPDVRHYIQQQKAKSLLRRVAYEYIQRSMPFLVLDESRLSESTKQALSSGRIPKVVVSKGNANNIATGVNFPPLSSDFNNFNNVVDDDIQRMVGVSDSGGRGQNVEFASVAKEAAANQQVRNSERADIVRDFMADIVRFWASLHQELGSDAMYVPMEDSQFPVTLSVDEIQGKFSYEIKPFSMNYEDPTILRQQKFNLLNLAISPQNAQALASQGASMNYVAIWKDALRTFDEPEVQKYLIDKGAKAEEQVANVLNDYTVLQSGQMPPVEATDNHMVHIMILGSLPDIPGKLELIQAHQQALLASQGQAPAKPGGGNPEGLPVGGVAANQDQFSKPLSSSPVNQKIAINREATDTM